MPMQEMNGQTPAKPAELGSDAMHELPGTEVRR